MENFIENWLIFVIMIVVIGAVICYNIAKKSNNRRAALTGKDKELVRKAAEPLLAESGSSRIVYAHWEKSEHYGRTTRTTFYRYVVAYHDQTLYISPLYVDKKTHQMQIARPSVFTPENLGKVTVRSKQKDGVPESMSVRLDDKQGKTLFQLDVEAENLQKNRFYPVNIVQQEECADLERFLTALAERVAAENPGVDDLIKADGFESLGIFGTVAAAIGAFLSIFFAPLGAGVTALGLILSVVGKMKGGKSKVPLMISMICAVVSAVFLVVFLAYPG